MHLILLYLSTQNDLDTDGSLVKKTSYSRCPTIIRLITSLFALLNTINCFLYVAFVWEKSCGICDHRPCVAVEWEKSCGICDHRPCVAVEGRYMPRETTSVRINIR